jgi:hypothetical protein
MKQLIVAYPIAFSRESFFKKMAAARQMKSPINRPPEIAIAVFSVSNGDDPAAATFAAAGSGGSGGIGGMGGGGGAGSSCGITVSIISICPYCPILSA